MIELNQKMLILKRFITKKWFFFVIPGEKLTLQVTNEECHLKWRKLEYQTRRVRSGFNRVIELNQKMLIWKRFIGKKMIFFVIPGKTDPAGDEWGISSKMKKIEYQTLHVRSCFNRVIELNQKMLILKRIIGKKIFVLLFRGKSDP